MARKNPLDFSLRYIEKFLTSFPAKSFSEHQFRKLFDTQKDEWHIPSHKQANDVINYLTKKGKLQLNYFSDDDHQNKKIYAWKTENEFTIISAVKSDSYYVYYTSMFLHELTLQIPKTIYLNYEHTPQIELNNSANISQESIDKAFSGTQRKSLKMLSFQDKKIVITNGKYTNRLGVVYRKNENEYFAYTDIERTLIDISVRPVYSGGVFEVLEAYKNAKSKVDVNKLAVYLKELNYIYPYNQVIGFYLEKAGYGDEGVDLFRNKIEFNFYLTYGIRNKEFSEEWRLFYPKGF